MILSLGLAFLLICFTLLFFNRSFTKWKNLQKEYQNISYLQQSIIPFLGNVPQLMIKTHEVSSLICDLSQKCQKDGKGLICIWSGIKPVIFLCSGDGLEGFINNGKQSVKSIEYKLLEPWLKTGLLTSKNEKWRTRRRLLTPSFHNNDLLESFMFIFHEQSQILVNRFETISRKSSKFEDLYPYISSCTLDIIAEAATGTHPNAQKGDLNNEYVKATIRIGEVISIRTRLPWLWPDFIFDRSALGKEHKNLLNILHKFTREIIEERLKMSNVDLLVSEKSNETRKRLAFLDTLIVQTHKENLTIDDIQEEVDTFMFEGHDTTAAAINFLLFLVGSDQTIQKKIHEEIDSIFGDDLDRMCTLEDIQKMNYLDCVIKESFRMLPSVPIIGREAQEDFVYRDQIIRKGTTINIFIHGIHHDEKYFPNPDKFDPSRFEEQNEKRPPYVFIPFSAGPRNCIGQRFASLEERVVLANLFRRFSFKSTQKVDQLKLSFDVILRTGVPIEMEIKRRF